jgi:hypothetical protein
MRSWEGNLIRSRSLFQASWEVLLGIRILLHSPEFGLQTFQIGSIASELSGGWRRRSYELLLSKDFSVFYRPDATSAFFIDSHVFML